MHEEDEKRFLVTVIKVLATPIDHTHYLMLCVIFPGTTKYVWT